MIPQLHLALKEHTAIIMGLQKTQKPLQIIELLLVKQYFGLYIKILQSKQHI